MTIIETIKRDKLDANALYGVVTVESPKLLCLHREYDFQFDGYVIVRTKDITKRYVCDSNNYCSKIMRKEKLWVKSSTFAQGIDLSSWRSALIGLENKTISIQDEKDEDFWIGKLVKINNTTLVIRHFDGVGKWIGEFSVPYSRITMVCFDNRYSRIHGKYLGRA